MQNNYIIETAFARFCDSIALDDKRKQIAYTSAGASNQFTFFCNKQTKKNENPIETLLCHNRQKC